MLGCNTAPYLLGSGSAARSALFYLTKYLSKDAVRLSTCISVLLDARQHIKCFASVAADTGTATRTAQYYVARVLNNLGGMVELSDTMVVHSAGRHRQLRLPLARHLLPVGVHALRHQRRGGLGGHAARRGAGGRFRRSRRLGRRPP